MLSVRAYDSRDLMIDADVVDGRDVETALTRMFGNERVRYMHVHYAAPGCYACRVDRAALSCRAPSPTVVSHSIPPNSASSVFQWRSAAAAS